MATEEDFRDPQTQRERRALKRIQRLQGECERLVDVSNDFLRFARVKDLYFEPTQLAGVVEEMLDFILPQKQAFPQLLGIAASGDATLDLLPRHEGQFLFSFRVDQASTGEVFLDVPHALAPIPRGSERVEFLLDGDSCCESGPPVDVAL